MTVTSIRKCHSRSDHLTPSNELMASHWATHCAASASAAVPGGNDVDNVNWCLGKHTPYSCTYIILYVWWPPRPHTLHLGSLPLRWRWTRTTSTTHAHIIILTRRTNSSCSRCCPNQHPILDRHTPIKAATFVGTQLIVSYTMIQTFSFFSSSSLTYYYLLLLPITIYNWAIL